MKNWLSELRGRFHFAYRNSFRSGCGLDEFFTCWKYSKELYYYETRKW